MLHVGRGIHAPDATQGGLQTRRAVGRVRRRDIGCTLSVRHVHRRNPTATGVLDAPTHSQTTPRCVALVGRDLSNRRCPT